MASRLVLLALLVAACGGDGRCIPPAGGYQLMQVASSGGSCDANTVATMTQDVYATLGFACVKSTSICGAASTTKTGSFTNTMTYSLSAQGFENLTIESTNGTCSASFTARYAPTTDPQACP